MKKFYTILVLTLVSVMAWAEVHVSVSPKVIDFGTVPLVNGEAEPDDFAMASLDYELAQWVYNVFIDTVGVQDPNCEFSAVADSGEDFWYAGDGQYEDPETDVWVSFYAIAAGDYEIKYHFYTWEDYNWENKVYGDELTVKVKVVDQATGIDNTQAAPKARKQVIDGQLYIVRGEHLYDMTGAQVR